MRLSHNSVLYFAKINCSDVFGELMNSFGSDLRELGNVDLDLCHNIM